MLTGFVLFYVGAVLCLNGLWLMGKIEDREIVVINIVSGLVSAAVVLHDAFGAAAGAGSIRNAALTLLFCTTYLWVAYNRWSGVDGRGLGWFSLFVAITAIPVTIDAFSTATSTWGLWFALCWLGWGLLWFLYFVLLVLQRPIVKFVGAFTVFVGIYTGWVPGYMLLSGMPQ